MNRWFLIVVAGCCMLGCAISGEKLPLNRSKHKQPVEWNWSAALPLEVTRAELVPAEVPMQTIASIAPELESALTLVSTRDVPDYAIQRIDKMPVKNLGDLAVAADFGQSAGSVPVVVSRSGSGPPEVLEVDSEQLPILVQQSSPAAKTVRLVHAGRQSIMIREDGVRCIVSPRVERNARLLQVIIETQVVTGGRRLLPVEIRAECEGEPLNCLTVAHTLRSLYGSPSRLPESNPRSHSFAAVSEVEDYLVPTNYRELLVQSTAKGQSYANRDHPALLELPGLDYPGPAILGDARALTSFLLQRHYQQPGDPPSIGWVMFSGESLRDGQSITVYLNLGADDNRLSFSVPE